VRTPSPDDQLDALALIRAFIDGDRDDLRVILDNADLRGVAVHLATLASIYLARVVGGDDRALEHIAWTQQQLAEREARQ
jgi:hypothetical protein